MAAFCALLTPSGSLLHLFLTWLLLFLVWSCSKSREHFKYFIWQLLQISSLGGMSGSDIWYTRLLELGSICAHTLTRLQPPPLSRPAHLRHPCPPPHQLQPWQAGHSPLDADGVGVLRAAARQAVRGVDGDREAAFAVR